MEFEDVYVYGCSVPTETLHLGKARVSKDRAPTASAPAIVWHTFFVPGNPGCLWYYLPWLQDVQAMQQQQADSIYGAGTVQVMVHGLSHANHHFSTVSDTAAAAATASAASAKPGAGSQSSTCSAPVYEAYGLDFQIEHVRVFVLATISKYNSGSGGEPSRPMLSFIGHSIGSYFVLDILQGAQAGDGWVDTYADADANADANANTNAKGTAAARGPSLAAMTVSVVLAMPFITWSTLNLGHRLQLSAFEAAPAGAVTWGAAKLLSLVQGIPLPKRITYLRRLQSGEGGMDDQCSDVTSSRFFTKRMISNFVAMGRDEILQVPANEERMLAIIADLSSRAKVRILSIHTDDDVWAPLQDKGRIEALAPQVDTLYVPGLQHAFCMVRGQHAAMTQALRVFTGKLLVHSPGRGRATSAAGARSKL